MVCLEINSDPKHYNRKAAQNKACAVPGLMVKNCQCKIPDLKLSSGMQHSSGLYWERTLIYWRRLNNTQQNWFQPEELNCPRNNSSNSISLHWRKDAQEGIWFKSSSISKSSAVLINPYYLNCNSTQEQEIMAYPFSPGTVTFFHMLSCSHNTKQN